MMARPNEEPIELIIPTHPRYLSAARLLVGGFGAQAGLSLDEVEDMKVAVSEAVTNVIDHAYGGELKGTVIVRYRPTAGELTVEVEDRGIGFDPGRVPAGGPPVPGPDGGLGLYLVRELADNVKVESAPGSGTKVTITKRKHG
jgi:serine/threonine-protein kinase RsbW